MPDRREQMYGNYKRYAKKLEKGYLGKTIGVSQYVIDKLKNDPDILEKLARSASNFRKYLKADRLTVYLSKERKVKL